MIAAALLWSTLVLHGVVDRIEGDMAAVEWEGEAVGLVPVELLPPSAAEGDDVVLQVRTRSRLRLWRRRLPDTELPQEVSPRRGSIRNRRARRALHRRDHARDDHQR